MIDDIDMTALDGMLNDLPEINLNDLPDITIDNELADRIAAELDAIDMDAFNAELEELAALLGPLDDLPDFDLDAMLTELDP